MRWAEESQFSTTIPTSNDQDLESWQAAELVIVAGLRSRCEDVSSDPRDMLVMDYS